MIGFSKPCYLYALACNTPNHFYIGTTVRMWGVRLDEHREGRCCKWTHKHGFRRVLWYREIDPAKQFTLEDEVTLWYMRRYGWEGVRGGNFVNAVDIDSEWFYPFWLPIEFGGKQKVMC